MKILTCSQILSSKGTDANERLKFSMDVLQSLDRMPKMAKVMKVIRKVAKHLNT